MIIKKKRKRKRKRKRKKEKGKKEKEKEKRKNTAGNSQVTSTNRQTLTFFPQKPPRLLCARLLEHLVENPQGARRPFFAVSTTLCVFFSYGKKM
jgi:hypothetical protein